LMRDSSPQRRRDAEKAQRSINWGPLRLLCVFASLRCILFAQPNYENDVKPLFARRCFACHSAGEMRSGLNLETYAGVLKGGSSGDAMVAGRAAGSLLYKAVAREEGAPQMPLGQAKLLDAEIAIIRDWIQGGLLETATSLRKGPVGTSAEYRGS